MGVPFWTVYVSNSQYGRASPRACEGTMPLRVLIADDSPVMRRAIRNLLASEPGIEIVGEATSFREMCELRAKYNPEIVVMDLHMVELPELTSEDLKCLSEPDWKILAISAQSPADAEPLALGLGAKHFMDKMDLGSNLIPKLHEMVSGN
jgi:DNA-binding NarL/FixJ family response regulator